MNLSGEVPSVDYIDLDERKKELDDDEELSSAQWQVDEWEEVTWLVESGE